MKKTDDNNYTRIYVVDDAYRIVHYNQVLKDTFPDLEIGQVCYEALCGEEQPCENCPLYGGDKSDVLFYNKKVRRWIQVNVGITEWPGVGKCSLLMAKEIDEDNKNLFYNLTSISAYDELYELNLTRDSYRTLYHTQDKYVMPEEDGSISKLIAYAADHMIHPDDREAFLSFWNLDYISEKMQECGSDYILKEQFRKKQKDGGYCWILETVVPLRYCDQNDKIVMCFVQDIDGQKMREHEIEDGNTDYDINRDDLTGLLKRNAFFGKAKQFLKQSCQKEKYCLAAVDIEHFKLFNEWYGQEDGDRFLVSIGSHLKNLQEEYCGIAGYIGEDDFAIILPMDSGAIDDLQSRIIDYVRQYGGNAGFLPAFGIYVIEDCNASVRTMYDRASIAMTSVKGNYARRVSWYDNNMMKKMEEDHKMLSEVQRGLTQGEFVFYAQPKCNMVTGKIVGLESLVRWNHPERGMISPGEFIPLLESNGFISNLDMYLWEEVCKYVKRWIDKGYKAVPISVNVSRVDIYTLDVVACFKNLVNKYQLDPSLIEIEITESAYVEEYDFISKAVENLRSAGFTVLMDDFGSGYSSLNMLKDVNVDLIKIDMKFLDMKEETAGKGYGILEAIISMAQLIGLRMIAEGVERREQVELLGNMGCLYGQGYYFYKPMCVEKLELLLADENNLDFEGIPIRGIKQIHMKELFAGNTITESIFNNIMGGIAFYDVCDDKIQLVRVNEQYYKVTGTNPSELEARRETVIEYIEEEYREKVLELFRKARLNTMDGAEGDVRRKKNDGSVIWQRLRVFFLKEQDGHCLFYGAVSDVTQQKQHEEMLKSSQKALAAAVSISEHGRSFMNLGEENRKAAESIFDQMNRTGMIGGYCEEGFPLYFVNDAMIKLLGYESYDELEAGVEGSVINTIHPDDRDTVIQDIGPEYYVGLEYKAAYRMIRKDGSWFWTLDKGKVVRAEDGRMAIVSACTDISEIMQIQQELEKMDTVLIQKNQDLEFLNNDMPGGYHRCDGTGEFDFLYISNKFLNIFGYTRDEIKELFDNKYMRMVHPDDRDRVSTGVVHILEEKDMYNLEYRMLSRNGYKWVIDQSRSIKYGDKEVIHGMVLDVTETVELRNRMKTLIKYIPETIVLIKYDGEKLEHHIIANGLFGEMGYNNDVIESFFKDQNTGDEILAGDKKRLLYGMEQAAKRRTAYRDVVQVTLKDGQKRWINLDVRFMTEEEQGISYLGVYSDVTSIKEKEQEIGFMKKKVESILHLADINSWDWDMNEGTLTLSNPEFWLRISKGKGRIVEGRLVVEGFPDGFMKSSFIPKEYHKKLIKYLNIIRCDKRNVIKECELPVCIADDTWQWIKIVCETIRDDEDNPVKAVGYYVDITRQKNQQIELTKMAERDPLTGLYNRQTAIPRIKDYLSQMTDESAALIMFDMDNFKLANDVFGHAYGDSMIAENGRKLRKFFHKDDIVCRIGGDEFLILCKNIKEEGVNEKLSKIVKSMVNIYNEGKREIKFSVSAGYAMIPEHGVEFDELYKRADIALFHTKMCGKSSFRKYRPSMKEIRYELAGYEKK